MFHSSPTRALSGHPALILQQASHKIARFVPLVIAHGHVPRRKAQDEPFLSYLYSQNTRLSFLPDHTEQLNGFSSATFPGQARTAFDRVMFYFYFH